ncbi:hypothetical protein [Methanolobus sp.]|uniref:phage NrS-1 polymerase family protein n=1 Tax=Methanolobus sp. TaxID=1874737 RepID=UPI0025D9BEA6|nr:hypothetical protein [Methanolobus sp.]
MWKFVQKPGKKKPDKVLFTVENKPADSTAPGTWNIFEACIEAFDPKIFNGIGFVFSYYDPYMGVDWDNIRNPETGEWENGTLEEIKRFASYAEISQSGTGAHVICKGEKPGSKCRRGNYEMYTHDRFFVVTGNHLEGTPDTINEAPPEAIKAVYDKIDPHREACKSPRNGSKESCNQEDEKVISLLMGSSIADTFESLWDGSTAGYPSNSEADYELAKLIAFYTQDEVRIERLMRQSGLARSKWDTHPTYLKATIGNAISSLTKRYTPPSVEGREQSEQQATNDEETDPLIKEAADMIASRENPVQFILDTHQSLHVGDLELAKTLLVSVGVQSVLNADGIQPKVSGESGKGKTHCCKAMAHLVPPKWIFETTLSDKAIFYMKGLKDGSIIFCDDIDLSETLEGVIKRATSNFQTGTTYTTLDIKRREETKRIPSRISWWLTSVDDDQSLQLLNRQFGGGVDESEEQDRKVVEFLSKKAASGEVGLPLNDSVLICREILQDIKSSNFIVKIPFVERITWRDTRNRRNYSIFLDILRGYTVLRHRQRQKDQEGALIAEVQDFNDAKALYTRRAENQGLKLSDAEMRLCIVLAGRGEATREEIAKALGKSVGRVSHLIYGKDRNKDAGLLHKVEGFYVEKRTVENSVGHKTQKTYLKLDGFDALGMFGSVVSLDVGDTHCYTTDTHTDTPIISNNTYTDTTDTNIDRVQQKKPNCVKNEKSDSLLTQKSNQCINGISSSQDSEKLGNSGSNIAGNSASAPPLDIGNTGNTAMQEHLLAWAPRWESSHKKSINRLNVTHVAMEYCKRYSVPSDKFTEVTDTIRRYAKIPTERPMSGPLNVEGEQTQAYCADCGSTSAPNTSTLINGQVEHRCHTCYQKYINRASEHPNQPEPVEAPL